MWVWQVDGYESGNNVCVMIFDYILGRGLNARHEM